MTLIIRPFLQQTLILFFLLILLMLSVLPIWSFFHVIPNFLSAIIFLWTVYRPHLTPRRVYVIVGLIRDSLLGYPLGVSVFEILLIVSITNFLRHYIVGRSYWVVFMGYGIFSILNHSLIWGILCCVKQTILPCNVIFKSTLLNILIYPLMCQISIFMQHKIDSLKYT